MPSQSISQPCCLCGWQMTELDLSVIRWGKISFLSPSRSLTHALFLGCVWVAHSPWCFSACEVYFFRTSFLLAFFSSKHFLISWHQATFLLHVWLYILLFFLYLVQTCFCEMLGSWWKTTRAKFIAYLYIQFHSILSCRWSLCQIRRLLSYLFLPCLGHETSQTTYWYPTFHGLLSRQEKHDQNDFWEQQWKRPWCVWYWLSHIRRSLKKKEEAICAPIRQNLKHVVEGKKILRCYCFCQDVERHFRCGVHFHPRWHNWPARNPLCWSRLNKLCQPRSGYTLGWWRSLNRASWWRVKMK